jgi:hypothetical protein
MSSEGAAFTVYGAGGDVDSAALVLKNGEYSAYISAGSSDSDIRYDAADHQFMNFGTSSNGYITGLQSISLDLTSGSGLLGNRIQGAAGADLAIHAVGASGTLKFYHNGSLCVEHDSTDSTFSNNIMPSVDSSHSIGSDGTRWYKGWFDLLEARYALTVTDLILNNTASEEPNSFDGTRGHWVIQEGADDLFIENKLNGKKYKFELEEI